MTLLLQYTTPRIHHFTLYVQQNILFYNTTQLPERSYQKERLKLAVSWDRHCAHCPVWLPPMLCPHPLHFLSLLVPVANVFLPCFFFSLFLSERVWELWVVPAHPKGKTVGTGPISWRCSECLLCPTFKFFYALVLASPLVTITVVFHGYLLSSCFPFLWHPLALSREALWACQSGQ